VTSSTVSSRTPGVAGRSGINAGSAGSAASLSAATATTPGQRGRLTPTRLGTPPSLATSTPLGARSSTGLSAISSSRSATVPGVGAAAATSNFNSSTVPNLAQAASYGRPYWSNGYPYYGSGGYYGYPGYGYGYGYYGYPYYGHCAYPGFGFYGYPFAFGFGFSVSFGYPYYGYYSPYAYGAYCYPYAGYYYGYPYRYLDHYYDCDFYDGYYVRFGYARASYYAACSGYGYHGYDHHCHHYACSSHGDHEYHVRDCPECYPSGSLTVDVDVPDEAITGATPQVESREISPTGGEGAARPLGSKEAFLAGLKPAQLSFVMGLEDLRKGNYEEATESLYSASLEDPDSRLVKVFLATSLFSVGEHAYAAEYLRLGLDGWDAFPSYTWDVRGAYGVPGDFDRHLASLEEEVRARPGDADRLLVLGFLKMHSGQPEGAASAFDSLGAVSTDPVDDALASRYVAEIEDRNGTFPRDPSEAARLATDEEPAVRAFLASQSPADVPELPIR